jgi:hypothetical protein
MSSSSSSSSELSTPSSLSSFDPLAVHFFTNCSAVQNTIQPSSNRSTPHPYRAPVTNFNLFHPLSTMSQSPPGMNGLQTNNTPSRLPSTTFNGFPSSPQGGIFVPYRHETPSPELEDILKSNKDKGSPSPNRARLRSNSPVKQAFRP